MKTRRRSLVAHKILAVLTLLSIVAGCASQRMKFNTLEKRDRLRFAACRHDVVRHVCPDDPDCDIKAAEMYAAEPADARLRWLLDYKCPREKIQRADQVVRNREYESIGVQPPAR